MCLTIGSLFSGIGGIELGFERSGGFETKWFVEKDLYCQAVLQKHWPGIPIYDDITTIDFKKLPKVEILTGGFPCQDISNAGKRAGIGGGEADCGNNTCEPLAQYDQNTHSLKTFQRCVTGDLTQFSATLPRSGIMLNGIVCPQVPLALLTEGAESLSSHFLPTVGASSGGQNIKSWKNKKHGLRLQGAVQIWPTVRAANPGSRPNGKGGKILEEEVLISEGLRKRGQNLWPTVTARSFQTASKPALMKGNPKKRLAEEVVIYPSPTTTTTGSNARKAHLKRTGKPLGQLTPEFCEWLMGFPIGFTELNALEMQLFQRAQSSLRKLSKKKKESNYD